jgi:amino acid transporter
MEAVTVRDTRAGTLAPARLGVWGIMFLVASAAAPLTVVVSAAPMAFRLGGIGAPGAMVFCGLVLGLFAVGFTAMSAHVPNAGAFYAYALHGLGKGAGIGLAFVTVFSYAFLCISFYAFFGFFGQLTFSDLLGINLPWWGWSLAAVAIVALLGLRQVDVGAKVLTVIVTAEVAILLVLAICVLANGGPEPLSAASFSPNNVFLTAGASALLVIGFGAYLGFESTAIYAEEARTPKRTIPRATYLAIAVLAGFYAFTFWMLTVAFGAKGVLAFAATDNFADMVFNAADGYVGAWAAVMIRILIVTSFFACILAFHNACSRYLFSLGRERVLPRVFARTSTASQVPATASLTLSILCGLGVVVAAIAAVDPYLGLALWTYATGVQGLVFGQCAAAVAVVCFFLRDRRGHSVWRVIIAPALGTLGLATGFTMIVMNFEITTGMEGAVNWILLLPTPVLFAGGFVYAAVLKRRSLDAHGSLGVLGHGDEVDAARH